MQKNIPELFGEVSRVPWRGRAVRRRRVGHIGDSLALIPAGVIESSRGRSLWDELSLRPSVASVAREVKEKRGNLQLASGRSRTHTRPRRCDSC